ncbi:MAG: phage tail assembly chaperone [Alphaproteobacteria bacterium]|nr:phage tail assembly chaperone [Alphaproteobacteria bacterium]
MGLACGVLFWTPDLFWKSSPDELFPAIDAMALANGSPEAEAKERRRKFKNFRESVEIKVGKTL